MHEYQLSSHTEIKYWYSSSMASRPATTHQLSYIIGLQYYIYIYILAHILKICAFLAEIVPSSAE